MRKADSLSMRKTVAVGLILASGLLLSGCVGQSEPAPTPTVTETATPQAEPSEVKLDVDLGVLSLNGLDVAIKQTGYGQANAGQLERWFGEEAEDPEKLVEDVKVVSLQYTVTNNTSESISLLQTSFGFGYWVFDEEFIPAEGEEISPKDNSTSKRDQTPGSVHERLGYPSFPLEGTDLAPGATALVNLDLYVPRPILDKGDKKAQFVTNLSYANEFSEEITLTLTLKDK
jgi:hypothetical protein